MNKIENFKYNVINNNKMNNNKMNNNHNEEKFINDALLSFGLDYSIDFLHRVVCTYPDKHIISVGSGSAFFEYQYVSKYCKEIICIDPAPFSWSYNKTLKKSFIEPKYPTTEVLIENDNTVIGNCILILNWCPPNESDFDYQAVQLLKPVAIFTTLEKFNGGFGAGGGLNFHNYLDRQNEDKVYKQVHITKLTESSMDFQIQWWQLFDLQNSPNLIDLPHSVKSKRTNPEVNCSVS